jgi:hypothetical protein
MLKQIAELDAHNLLEMEIDNKKVASIVGWPWIIDSRLN